MRKSHLLALSCLVTTSLPACKHYSPFPPVKVTVTVEPEDLIIPGGDMTDRISIGDDTDAADDPNG